MAHQIKRYAGRKLNDVTAALRGNRLMIWTYWEALSTVMQAGSLSGLRLGRYG
jgi:hypothetical protein